MIINLFSYRNEASKVEDLIAFNGVVAWSLRKAFRKQGVKARLVSDKQLYEEDIPEADNSIAISSWVMRSIRDDAKIRTKIRNATRNKLVLYLETDYGHWEKFFDYVFTVIKPTHGQERYLYGGWGADPEFFYPEQDEKAIFIDSLMYEYNYGKAIDDAYDLIKEVFSLPEENLKTGKSVVYETVVGGDPITVYMPNPIYKTLSRLPWPEMQKIMRKCSFHLCTQRGEAGLPRIEAATCGALLLVPEGLYRPRSMDSLDHIRWQTKQELINALAVKTNPVKIRKRALEHSWDKVVKRMLPYFRG